MMRLENFLLVLSVILSLSYTYEDNVDSKLQELDFNISVLEKEVRYMDSTIVTLRDTREREEIVYEFIYDKEIRKQILLKEINDKAKI